MLYVHQIRFIIVLIFIVFINSMGYAKDVCIESNALNSYTCFNSIEKHKVDIFPFKDRNTNVIDGDLGLSSSFNTIEEATTKRMFNMEVEEDCFRREENVDSCLKIGNIVWYDYNENDIYDSEENGLNGLKVNLYKETNGLYVLWETMVTDHKPGSPNVDGWYEFCSSPGRYYIEVVMPPMGLVQALPNVGINENIDNDLTNEFGEGTTSSFLVVTGQNKLNIGAGFYPMATIEGEVWSDINFNGIHEYTEISMANIEVELYTANGLKISSTVSNENGEYRFDYIQKGDYFIKFNPSFSYITLDFNSEGDGIDTNVDNSNGPNTTRTYSTQPGDIISDVDAGLVFVCFLYHIEVTDAIIFEDFIEVYWKDASDFNVDYYEIEVRHESESEMRYIATIPSEGLSNEVQFYSWKYNEHSGEGNYCYRVKGFDEEGFIIDSNIYSVYVSKNSFGGFYPNPVVNEINLEYSLRNVGNICVSLNDIQSGRIIKKLLEKEQRSGNHSEIIQLEGVPKGNYILKVQLLDEIFYDQLIKVGN